VFVVVRAMDAGLARVLGPRIRMTLYALVLLRVVLPTDFSTPLGLLGAIEPEPASTAELAAELEAPAIAVPWLSRGQRESSVAASVSPAESSASPLRWIWLAGVLVVLGVAAMRRRHLARIVAQSRPASGALAEQGGSARVLVHPDAGPFAAGHRRKVIVLPRPLVDRLDDQALRWVVAHERAHHEGRDPWLASTLTLATALAWPVLPVWLAARRVRALVEHAADERAVALVAGARRSYGRVLLDLVAETPVRRVMVGLGAYRDLRSRIAAIVRPARTPAAAQLGVAAVVAGVLVACTALPTQDEPEVPREQVCDDLIQRAMAGHDEAERERDARKRELAIARYDEYIDLCADAPGQASQYGDMIYYAAEAHWAVAVAAYDAGHTDAAERSWNRARTLFDLAIDEGAAKFSNDAAYGQYLSTRNALRWDGREEAAACEGCEPLAFVPYDAAEREVIAS
jgi:MYXO-CTERM domain-containing protein